jgi:hypothetical protein
MPTDRKPVDQGRWHCSERNCPGGHMLPNGSCKPAEESTDAAE